MSKHREEITHIRTNMNLIRSKINARIPVEILAEIFTDYIDASRSGLSESVEQRITISYDDVNERTGYLSPRPCRWLRIAHVCHHWRSICLSLPRLWSAVVLYWPKMATKCISLSQNVPLHVFRLKKTYWRREELEYFALALPHLSRMASLHIPYPPSNLDTSLGSLEGGVLPTGPMLTSISLGDLGIGQTLLNSILKFDPPQLERLVILQSVYDTRDMPPLPASPRYLIMFLKLAPRVGVGVPMRLEKLENLQSLRIFEPLSLTLVTDNPRRHGVNFPQVKYLHISSSRAEWYLKSLSFPSTTQIQLTCGSHVQWVEVCGGTPHISLLMRSSGNRGSYTFSYWTDTLAIDAMEEIPARLKIHCNIRTINACSIAVEMAQALPSLKTLYVQQGAPHGSRTMRTLSQHLRNLRNLAMLERTGYVWLSLESKGKTAPLWTSYPHLQCLTIFATAWNQYVQESLQRCLQVKEATTSGKLSRLEIPCSLIEPVDLTVLENLVDEVVDITSHKRIVSAAM